MIKRALGWLDNNILKVAVVFLLVFIPLYPKFPLLDLKNTWIYIRLDDIAVFFVVLIFGIQLLRRKATLKSPLTKPIFLYWIAGLITTIYALLFILGSLPHVFPNLSVLHYLRRIEYMVVFFVAFNSVKSKSDVKLYLTVLFLTVFAIVIYAVGQRFAGFPAVITMNEEFAKGKLLYLPPTARITATFAGHYDLAAYLVLVIPILFASMLSIKSRIGKVSLVILSILSYITLLFTESRISIAAYFLAMISSLLFLRKRLLLIPVLIISLLLTNYLSGSSERFYKTFRIRDVAFNLDTGKPVSAIESLDKKTGIAVAESQEITKEMLPVGTGFIGLPGGGSSGSIVSQPKQPSIRTEIRTLQYKVYDTQALAATGGAKLATVSGRFLIRKALVYDISFTTRFQGEWPRAMEAFRRNPILGSGFSTISLATDNDYLRMIGETGILGTLAFLGIFFSVAVILVSSRSAVAKGELARNFAFGTAGGIIGLAFNGILIDVFEASKVAYTLWLVLGIGLGALLLNIDKKYNYINELFRLLKAKFVLVVLLVVMGLLVYIPLVTNYFTGDDFTWLKWASKDGFEDTLLYFIWADGFFYRPLQKLIYLAMFNIFWLQPWGYHMVSIGVHILSAIGIFQLAGLMNKKKTYAFITAVVFLLLSSTTESVFWVSSIGNMMAVLFTVWSVYIYANARNKGRILPLVTVFIFNILAMLSYEGGIIAPLMLLSWELIYGKRKWLIIVPNLFLIPAYIWVRVLVGAHGLAGDYNYNFVKLPLNFVGNFLAYLVMLITGPRWSGEWFTNLRFLVKQQDPVAMVSTILFAIGVAIFLIIAFQKRKKLSKLMVFGLVYVFISLLPFLGLGNVSIRYSYVAAPGFALILSFVVIVIFDKLKQNKWLAYTISGIVLVSILGFNYYQLRLASRDWVKAGNIVQETILRVKNRYFPLTSEMNFYFVNRPIRYGVAWVLPVGLDDAFWHSFQDPRLHIHQATSVGDAFRLSVGKVGPHVFYFSDGVLEEIQPATVEFEKEFTIIE